MSEPAAVQALAESVGSVLEQMFFVTPLENPPPPETAEPPPLAARVCFDGAAAGSLTLELSPDAAGSIAADFLAEDAAAIEPRQVEDVVRELANMLCGAALSRLGSEQVFHLRPPEILPAGEEAPRPDARYTVDIGSGRLTATLSFDR